MAEHQQLQRHPQHQELHPTEGPIKSLLPDKGPSASQVVAVATLFPIGGILLTLSGLTLTATVIGLAIATPLFVIFSPVIIPAAIVIGLAVTGFLASGAFGLTALSSLSWILNYVRGTTATVPELHLDYAKRRMHEVAGQVGQRTKELGQGIQSKSQT
ncbi:Oleosin 5 [Acorus gramineus]|uniref:Oleosin n=1 Tax=Acorus gramineus TaxID=55184 RepID=A0AAV9BW99_ACOGR|nr:Oleosin 5 [Acorus gramineus]